ncbi:sortase [Candidatus Roizmanbacteria bacterium]|nr:sortase [Candidatus Roizmanbacteria bacterium]
MSLYVYKKEKYSQQKRIIHYFSYASLTVGTLLLFWSFYPVVSFEIYSRIFIQQHLFSPIPRSHIVSSLSEANSVLGNYNIFSNNLRDFTQVSLWFPAKPQKGLAGDIKVKEYSLSIPKLNIKDAKVIVGGEDLKKSLVHYLPQSLPGEYGNVVIFGHSTLPQLYNTKNYTTIFTYLPSLEKGDKIRVKVEEEEYEYETFETFVVNPDQISVLEQMNDASYLTLITCVPPGTYWKRLVLRAKLTKLPGKL